jgi:hypothetical protein
MKKIILFTLLSTLVACSSTSKQGEVKLAQMEPTDPTTTSVSIPSTSAVVILASTSVAEPSTTSPTPENATSTPIPDSHIETVDLSTFVSTWNSHDVQRIRTLYTDDAKYYSEAEMQKLYQEEPIDVLVTDASFTERINRYTGLSMRILGEPMMIYDKLVAFLYRWENSTEGYDGAALLRLENNKIFMHSFTESGQLTPNPKDPSAYVKNIDLDPMMEVWNNGDPNAAQEIYNENSVILSDEDLAKASWRDFSTPPKINQLVTQFAGWNPAILDKPKGIGSVAIFAWYWETFAYPKGYGVRLVHLKEYQIITDVRYAIRPWEANGKPFMNP